MERVLWAMAAFAIGYLIRPELSALEDKLARERGLRPKAQPQWAKTAMSVGCGAVYALLAAAGRPAGQTAFSALVLSLCWVATWFDIRYRRIPNELLLCILACGLGFVLSGQAGTGLGSSLTGMLIAGALFLAPYLFGGKVGAGDVKLAAAIGFCTGGMGALYAVAVMGGLVLIYTLFSRNTGMERFREQIPMGPFVTAAYLLLMIR